MASNLFCGATGKAAHLGSISSFESSPGAAYWNPSLLPRQKTALSIDFTPNMTVSPGDYTDLEGSIKNSTDSAIESFRAEDSEISYTRLGIAAHQLSRIASVSAVLPLRQVSLGVYYNNILDLELTSIFSGLSTRINTKLALSDTEDDLFFNSFVEGHFRLRMGLDELKVAAGRRLLPGLSAGVALHRYSFSVAAVGRANVEGTMLFGGKENTFNNPNDNWHNDLNQALTSGYKGSALGGQLALSYEPAEFFQINLIYERLPQLALSGHADIVNNTVPALNLESIIGDNGAEEEILDASKLKLSQLTLTKEVANKTYPAMTINLPSMLKIGMAWQWRGLALHLLYSRRMSPFSIVYGDDELSLPAGSMWRAGFDFKYFQMSLGAIEMEPKIPATNYFSPTSQKVWAPLFSLGSSYDFGGRYTAHLLLVSVPSPLLRTGLTIRLE